MPQPGFTAALVALLSVTASAQDFLDDFNDGDAADGSPVTWVPSPAFDAAFDVIGGDLMVTMDGDTISSPRVDRYFAEGASVRARMVGLAGPGRYTVAFADQPTGIKGYVASFSTCQGGRLELFRGDHLGQIRYLGVEPVAYTPEEEFIIQLDVFDGVVTARLWRPGEGFPEAIISAPDTTYADGVPSIAIQDFGGAGGNGCGGGGDTTDAAALTRYAQASSTPLVHSGCADFNGDGVTNTTDMLAFLDAWAAGDAGADTNGDGSVNTLDVLAFLGAWSGGC